MADRIRVAVSLACWVFLLGHAVDASAITGNQLDDFQGGTVQNWAGNFPSPPTNQPTGGPAGAGDRFLQVSASNFNLGTFNAVQWSGNYLAAGIKQVQFHARNIPPPQGGGDPLSLRIVLFTPGCNLGTPNCTAWSSTAAQPLLSSDGWVVASFSLAEANLTRVFGTLSYSASLGNVERLLIRHDDGAPSPPGTQALVTATLGIDNVLPEPAGLSGLIAGAAILAALARRDSRP